jgi:hypothetical protein
MRARLIAIIDGGLFHGPLHLQIRVLVVRGFRIASPVIFRTPCWLTRERNRTATTIEV